MFKGFSKTSQTIGRGSILFLWLLPFSIFFSYFQVSFEIKLWLFLIGWVSGIVCFFRYRYRTAPMEASVGLDKLTRSIWAWAFVGTLAIFMRFWWYGNFPNWPLYDEMINGYYAMKLQQHWNWQFYFFWTQLPPLLIWLLAGFFKILHSDLDAIRVLPAILSMLIIPLAYASVRQFYSQRLAFLYLAFFSTSFGFLYFGRICHQGLLLLLWEFLTFYLMAKAVRARDQKGKTLWLVFLGLAVGIGFYTYFSWPVVGFMMSVPVFWSIHHSATIKEKFKQSLLFMVPMGLTLIPLLRALGEEKFGSYYHFLLLSSHHGSIYTYLLRVGEILSGFLWGYPISEFFYGPVWGGFFNPVSGCCLVIGAFAVTWKLPPNHRKWLGIAVVLFLTPAFLSGPPLSEMRIIQILPLFSFLVVQGLESLCSEFPESRKMVFLISLFILSVSLNFWHLQKAKDFINPYWKFQKTQDQAAAYPILQKKFELEKGPGYILTDLTIGFIHDYSLRVACYPFNALDNAKWKDVAPHWVAFLVNIHYEPFLKKRFPEGQWYQLANQMGNSDNNYDGGLMVGIIPIRMSNEKDVRNWITFEKQIEAIQDQVMRLPPNPARVKAMALISQMEPTLPKDPLLQSCFWDIVFMLDNLDNFYGANSLLDLEASLQAVRNGIQRGYPTAFFYNELGTLYYLEKQYGKSEKAFENAIHAPIDLTTAQDNLRVLEKMIKTQDSFKPYTHKP